MEIKTRIDTEKNIRYHVVEGRIEPPALAAALGSVYASDRYDPSMSSLWDFRDADFKSVGAADVRSLGDIVQSHWGQSRRSRSALVVSRDLGFGLSRMYEMNLNDDLKSQVRVFRDMDAALAWIESD